MQGFSVIASGLHPAATSSLGQERSSDRTESHPHLRVSSAQICEPTLWNAEKLSPKQMTEHKVRKMVLG